MELQGNAEKVTGGCFCGAVRYEAEAYLEDAYYCHCRICQKFSGAPAEVAVLVKPGSFHFTRGEAKYHPTSHFAERGFCPDCGSRLIWRRIASPCQAHAIGWLQRECSSLGGGTKVRFPRIWISSGECRLYP